MDRPAGGAQGSDCALQHAPAAAGKAILIGLGANLPGAWRHPAAVLEAALERLAAGGIRILARSGWYESAPVPPSGQPWYVNGVAEIETALGPAALLGRLHEIEHEFGRVRGVANGARVLDLDLLDHGGRIETGWPVLPHPRLAGRGFVLLPLREIRPHWRHPVTGATIDTMLAGVDPAQVTRPLVIREDQP